MTFSNSVTLKSACLLMMSLGLFACGKDKPAESATANPAKDASTATTNNTATNSPSTNTNGNDKVLTIATTSDSAPFSFADEKGVITGFDADVLQAIAKNKGLNIQFKPTTFDNLFAEIESGTSDIAASAIFQTEERMSKYGTTNAYYADSSSFYYLADNPKLSNATLNNLSDLNGKDLDLVAPGGTQSFDDMSTVKNVKSANELKSDYLSFTTILKKEADVAFADTSILRYYMERHAKGNPNIKFVPYTEKTNYVFLVNKNNAELLQKLNEGIDELTKNGEIKTIAQKYGLE